MDNVILDVAKTKKLIEAKGLKHKWVVQQIGLKSTAGHFMLRIGLLPKDDETRDEALGKLGQILGVEAKDLLLQLRPKKVAS